MSRSSSLSLVVLSSFALALPAAAQERPLTLSGQAASLRASAARRRIVGVSLLVPGVLVLGTGIVWAASVTASSCNTGDGFDCLNEGIEMEEAMMVGFAGGLISVIAIAVWTSATGLEDRARILDAMEPAFVWVAPTDGGAVAGVRFSMR